MRKTKSESKKSAKKKCKEYVGEYSSVYLRIKHKTIWIVFSIISVATLFIGGFISGAIADNNLWMLLVLLAPSEVICAYLYYAIIYAKRKRIVVRCNEIYFENKSYAEKRKNEIDKLIDDPTLVHDHIFEAHSAINDRVISNAYNLDKEFEDKWNKLTAEIHYLNRVWNQRMSELSYLPAGLPTMLLPKIIMFMESGMASDYQTAAWQASQDEKAEAANNMLLFEQKMANLDRKFELQKQGRMQEEYNRKHLDEVKRATDAARRSEQYAKEQAQAAQRAAELQQAIVKNTEKTVDYLKKIKNDE